jgi:localization factor PodJL
VQGVEYRSAEAAERVGGQISRIANAVEDRLARADAIQAQALEKLGGEIARITERLADRIAATERRSAQAIDDVGEQVARVTERVSQRQERSNTELTERIRQSEERTARLLEEARQTIDERLAESHRRFAGPERAAEDDADDSLFDDASAYEPAPKLANPYARPTPATLLSEALRQRRGEPAPFEDADFEAAAEHEAAEALGEPPRIRALAERAAEEDEISTVALEPNVGFDMDDEDPDLEAMAAADDLEGADEELGPFEVMAEGEADAVETTAEDELDADEFEASLSALASRIEADEADEMAFGAGDVIESAGSGAGRAWPARDSVLEGLTFGRSRKAAGGMTGALMVASLLAAVSVSAGGFLFLEGEPGGKLPKRVADSLALGGAAAKDGSGWRSGAPIAAVALSPKLAASTADMAAQYAAAVAKVEANKPGGLAELRRLGDVGFAPAQFYLSKLYEDGKGGAKKDPVEARRWAERAAEGGDRAAMHNLALDYFEGVGGPRNAATAAEWFRRAAELGLLDSQFNLAGLYEHGDGVSQNAAEAYKWYLVAGRAGDAESRAGALRVRALLTPPARALAERAAAAFQASPAVAPAPAPTAASPDLATAQRALNQLGYYQGPTDGAASPALHLALAAYQRDQGLPVTGSPDATTIAKLSANTR